MEAAPRPPEIKVENIMTTNVHTVQQTMTVREVIIMLTQHKISGAPVVDKINNVVSVLTEGDALKLAATPGGLDKVIGKCLDKLPKTENLITAKASDSFADVYKKFLAHPVHRVLVVDAGGKLQGLVSRSNVLRVLVENSEKKAQAAGA